MVKIVSPGLLQPISITHQIRLVFANFRHHNFKCWFVLRIYSNCICNTNRGNSIAALTVVDNPCTCLHIAQVSSLAIPDQPGIVFCNICTPFIFVLLTSFKIQYCTHPS